MKSPFFGLFCLFILTAKGHLEIIDTDYSIRTALSILENGSMRIKPTDPEFIKYSVNPDEDGLIYSQYGIGLPFLFMPFIILAQTISSFIYIPQNITIPFLISFYNIPFTMLSLWFIKEILFKLGINKKQANATTVIVAICTSYWHYSVSEFSEITQLAFLLGCIYTSIINNKNKWRYFSIWFSLLISIKVAYLILLPVFIIYGLVESKKRKNLLLNDVLNGASFILPFGIILGIFNYVRFGSFIEFGYGGNPGFGFSISNLVSTCFPSIFSLNYGIIPFNPILLVFPLWIKLFQHNRSFGFLTLLIIGIWFSIMCSYNYGWGWGWGQRYLFVVVPLLVLPIAYLPSINLNKMSKILFILLAYISSFIQLMSVSTKIHEPLTMRLELKDNSQSSTIGQLPSTFLLFKHKLFNGSSNYPLSIIGGKYRKSIDLSGYDSFKGFNFWPVHMIKFLMLDNYIRIFELFLLLVIIFLQFLLLKIYLPHLIGNQSKD